MSRPRGGINERLHWLPVSAHKQLERAVNWICGKPFQSKKLAPLPAEGEGSIGLFTHNTVSLDCFFVNLEKDL